MEQEESAPEIKGIYNGELDFNTIKESPILKPIAEINETFINLELMINRALIEYQYIEDEINKMIQDNPVYSETMLMGKIQLLKNNIKLIIHSQDLQKTNMRVKINEMIKLNEEEYDLRAEEIISELPNKVGRPKIEVKEEIPEEIPEEKVEVESKEESDIIRDVKKLEGNEGEQEDSKEKSSKENDKGVYSDLVERRIPKGGK